MISSSLKYPVRAIYIVGFLLLAGCREGDQNPPMVTELQTVRFRIIFPDLRDKTLSTPLLNSNITHMKISVSKIEKPRKPDDYILFEKSLEIEDGTTAETSLSPGDYYITKLVVLSENNPIFFAPNKDNPALSASDKELALPKPFRLQAGINLEFSIKVLPYRIKSSTFTKTSHRLSGLRLGIEVLEFATFEFYCLLNADFVTDIYMTLHMHTDGDEVVKFCDNKSMKSIIGDGNGLVVDFPKGYKIYYLSITYKKGTDTYIFNKSYTQEQLIAFDRDNPLEIKLHKKPMVHVTSVSLSDKEFHFFYYDFYHVHHSQDRTLTATVLPADASNQRVTWKITPKPNPNKPIITIDKYWDGGKTVLISAHNVGKATVTVRTADGDKEASCKYVVEHEMGN